MKTLAALACVTGLLTAAGGFALAAPESALGGGSHAAEAGAPAHTAEVHLTSAQSDYLEQCGGCHGLQGSSVPSPIPVLKGRVGYFMCTKAGREYLGRLPNVAYSKVDDAALAEMLNFVVFDLGEGTAPAKARPFEAAEVGRLRAQPMMGQTVEITRKAVVEDLVRSCAAPASLRQAYATQSADAR